MYQYYGIFNNTTILQFYQEQSSREIELFPSNPLSSTLIDKEFRTNPKAITA